MGEGEVEGENGRLDGMKGMGSLLGGVSGGRRIEYNLGGWVDGERNR